MWLCMIRILPHNDSFPTPAALPAKSLYGLLLISWTRVLVSHAAEVPIIILKSIRFLAVNGIVTNGELFVIHTQGDTADVFDKNHDEGGPDNVPADDEEGTNDLKADLPAIARDGATRILNTEGSAAFGRGPKTWRHSSARGSSNWQEEG